MNWITLTTRPFLNVEPITFDLCCNVISNDLYQLMLLNEHQVGDFDAAIPMVITEASIYTRNPHPLTIARFTQRKVKGCQLALIEMLPSSCMAEAKPIPSDWQHWINDAYSQLDSGGCQLTFSMEGTA